MPLTPTCTALVPCLDLQTEGRRTDIIDVVEEITFGPMPWHMPRLCVYVAIRGLAAGQEVRVRLLGTRAGSVDEVDIIQPIVLRSLAIDPLKETILRTCQDGVTFPWEGVYRYAVEVDGVYLLDRLIPIRSED